jgi:DNA-binding NarL/FixJ family response regulator
MGAPSTSTIPADPSALPAATVRVVIVDSQHDRRQLMKYVVQLGGPDVAVVGYAESPQGAVGAVGSLAATAALVEIQMPVAEGLDTVTALRDRFPELRIVVCSFHATERTRATALARGADAYLVKPLSPADLSTALRAAPVAAVATP